MRGKKNKETQFDSNVDGEGKRVKKTQLKETERVIYGNAV